jgi:hypothetical protein
MSQHISAEEVILNIKALASADYAVKVKQFFKSMGDGTSPHNNSLCH